MSDYDTDDRLDVIERKHADGWDVRFPEVAWLISEVRRLRSESSDHVAAKYWGVISHQRAEIQELRAANSEIMARLNSCETDKNNFMHEVAENWRVMP